MKKMYYQCKCYLISFKIYEETLEPKGFFCCKCNENAKLVDEEILT